MPSSEPRISARMFAAALLVSSGLQIAETLLPRIPLFPWLRLGFSWVLLLPFLLEFGTGPALALFLARNLLALSCGAQPLSTFVISTLSGVAALGLMGPVVRALVRLRLLGLVGASALLAAAFNGLQLLVVTWGVMGHGGFLFQLGPILMWSVVSGSVVAWLAHRICKPGLWEGLESRFPQTADAAQATPGKPLWMFTLALAVGTVLVMDWRLQAALLLVLLCLPIGARWRVLWSGWPFYLYLGWFHLLDTPGHFLSNLPVTREGLAAFAVHALRLGNFLLLGSVLVRQLPWERLRHSRHPWLQGTALAVPHLPRLFPVAIAAARTTWRERKSHGGAGFLEALLKGLDGK
jgi:Heptaprenyl diphosphate synthase component I